MTMRRCGWALALLALAWVAPTGMSDGQQAAGVSCGACQGSRADAKGAEHQVYAIYSLDDLGDDGTLGPWVAETIQEVIEPGSWNRAATSGRNVIRYHGPKKILVVYHTQAVQAQVEGFLKNVKKALPRRESRVTARQAVTEDHAIVRATYQTPAVVHAAEPAPAQLFTYPVPPPVAQPKHLFHFIIRYEGAGIIDSNVVRFMKAQNEQRGSTGSDTDNSGPRGVIRSITGGTSAPTPPTPEADGTKDSGDSLAPPRVPSLAKPVKTDKAQKKAADADKE